MKPNDLPPDEWTARIPEVRTLYPTLVKSIRFPPGRVLLTPGAAQRLQENEDAHFLDYLIRHLSGDWGDLDVHDRKVNEEALKSGQRLLSSYTLPDGRSLWIITDADRSCTTALTPEEY